jgi:hypothetical protein
MAHVRMTLASVAGSRKRLVLLFAALLAVVMGAFLGVQAAGGARSAQKPASGTRNSGTQRHDALTGALRHSAAGRDALANQPTLDAAANDAESVAGSSYYTNAVVNDAAHTVDLYLANAPQSVVDQLNALHPGIYVIHNDAANPRSALLNLMNSMDIAALNKQGVDVSSLTPMSDGYLQVGVTSNVTAATTAIDSSSHGSLVQVVRDTDPAMPASTAYRYYDFAPWNGGDFIHHVGANNFKTGASYYANCTSGIPVHDTSSGQYYTLTAAHCFYMFGGTISDPGGIYTNVHNSYYETTGGTYDTPPSGASMGQTLHTDHLQDFTKCGCYTNDTALIGGTGIDTSDLDFYDAWNSSNKTYQYGVGTNHQGDYVCTQGAPDGLNANCNIQITDADTTKCTNGVDKDYGFEWCTHNLARAAAPSGVVAVGEGDSGGPVMDPTTGDALGMIDMLGEAYPVTCTSEPTDYDPALADRSCSSVVFYTKMSSIDSEWGVTPNT